MNLWEVPEDEEFVFKVGDMAEVIDPYSNSANKGDVVEVIDVDDGTDGELISFNSPKSGDKCIWYACRFRKVVPEVSL